MSFLVESGGKSGRDLTQVCKLAVKADCKKLITRHCCSQENADIWPNRTQSTRLEFSRDHDIHAKDWIYCTVGIDAKVVSR
jgi:hypothetical protein